MDFADTLPLLIFNEIICRLYINWSWFLLSAFKVYWISNLGNSLGWMKEV